MSAYLTTRALGLFAPPVNPRKYYID